MKSHPDTKLIIIDTFQRIRSPESNQYSYADDYREVDILKQFASQHEIAIIPDYEESLDTTMITRSLLDRLMEDDVFSYAHLMITGKMQAYLDDYAREYSDLR